MSTRTKVAAAYKGLLPATFAGLRAYAVASLFVALSVTVPWVFHQFGVAGQVFLPMHFFVLAAGLLFGWQAGLLVGLCSPALSHALAGMPVSVMLPQVTLELASYGFIAGILAGRYHWNSSAALVAALAGGRLVFVTFLAFTGADTSPAAAVWHAAQQGWPGIVLQLVLVSPVVYGLRKALEPPVR